ncbi:MAG: diguanylate cyclase [Clostridiales bacterium]|nr:diguanylate cyclase [Clostridiales bacterium]
MIRFLGRGSAFSDEHNSAFFVSEGRLILIDCAMSSYQKVKKMNLQGVKGIDIFVTHTHSDHVSGIAMLIDYFWFTSKLPVTVVAPSQEVLEDLDHYLRRIDGCDESWFDIVTASDYKGSCLKAVIPTTHSEQLEGRCFGYAFDVDGTNVVYTGDSNTIEPFREYLTDGTELYMEVSSARSPVHMQIDDMLPFIKSVRSEGVKVFLMHLDNEAEILSKIEGTGASLAPLYEGAYAGGVATEDMIYDITDKLYKTTCRNDEQDHNMIFGDLTTLGKNIVGADRASFWKWDKRRHELWTTAATGVDRIVIPDDTGLVGKAIMNKSVLVTNDPYSDPDFNSSVDMKTGYLTKSVMVLPVADVNGEFIGAFQLINKLDNKGFDAVEDARKLSLPALICGLALESDTFLDDAHHDRLTKLKNRIGFYSDFSRKFMKYLETDCDRPLSMFICDIDKFKLVNDTYGHNAGDQVLEHAAKLIMESCEKGENAYRWGGEEFIVMMPDTDLMKAAAKAEKLRATIEASDFPADGITIKKTMSFGVHEFVKGKSIEDNVSLADARLYTAKETGRNKVVSE